MISPNSLKNQKKTKCTSRNGEIRQAMEKKKYKNKIASGTEVFQRLSINFQENFHHIL